MAYRRNILKLLSVAGGAGIVESWSKPIVQSVILPAHATTSPDPDSDGTTICFGATEIECGDTVSGSTTGQPTYDPPFCGTSLSSAPGVWYHFVGPGGNVMVTLSTCNQADFDTKIGVFRGSCNGLICVGGQDDTSGCSLTTELTVSTEANVDYHIIITGFGSASGDFDLSVTCVG